MKKSAALLSLLVLILVLVSSAFAATTAKYPTSGVLFMIEDKVVRQSDGAIRPNNNFRMGIISVDPNDKSKVIHKVIDNGAVPTNRPTCDAFFSPTKERRFIYRGEAKDGGKAQLKIYNPLTNYEAPQDLSGALSDNTMELKGKPVAIGDYLYVSERSKALVYVFDMVRTDANGCYKYVETLDVKEAEGFDRIIGESEVKKNADGTYETTEAFKELMEKDYPYAPIEQIEIEDFYYEIFNLDYAKGNMYSIIVPRGHVKFNGASSSNGFKLDGFFVKFAKKEVKSGKLVIEKIGRIGRNVNTSRYYKGNFYVCNLGNSSSDSSVQRVVLETKTDRLDVTTIFKVDKDHVKGLESLGEKAVSGFTITPDGIVLMSVVKQGTYRDDRNRKFNTAEGEIYKIDSGQWEPLGDKLVLDTSRDYFCNIGSFTRGWNGDDYPKRGGMYFSRFSEVLNKLVSLEGNGRICVYDLDKWSKNLDKTKGLKDVVFDFSQGEAYNKPKNAKLDSNDTEQYGRIVYTPQDLGGPEALRMERINILKESAQIKPKPVIPDYDDDKDDDDLDIETDSDTDFDDLDDLEDLKELIEDIVDNLKGKAAAAGEKFLIKKDGKYVADEEIAKTAAKSCNIDAESAHPIPVFKSTNFADGKLAAASYLIQGSFLGAEKAAEVNIMKLRNSKKGVLYRYVGKEKASDGTFTILDQDGKVCDLINREKMYTVTLFIKKGGKYDLSSQDGKILDPAVIVKGTKTEAPNPDTKPETKPAEGGSGGGCNAGFAGLALVALLPLFKKTRR